MRSSDLLRDRLHEVIFESDTRAGRAFDVILLWLIPLSVAAVMLESVASIRARLWHELRIVKWGFTVLFSLEYAVRVMVLGGRRPTS